MPQSAQLVVLVDEVKCEKALPGSGTVLPLLSESRLALGIQGWCGGVRWTDVSRGVGEGVEDIVVVM